MVDIDGDRYASASLWLSFHILFDDLTTESIHGGTCEQPVVTDGDKEEKFSIGILQLQSRPFSEIGSGSPIVEKVGTGPKGCLPAISVFCRPGGIGEV